HASQVPSVTYSPDGRRLASAGGGERTVKVWDATAKPLVVRFGPEKWAAGAAFSPDSRRLAVGHEDQTVRGWAVATAREPLRLRGHAAPVTLVAYSPDGRRLVSMGSAIHWIRIGLYRLGPPTVLSLTGRPPAPATPPVKPKPVTQDDLKRSDV